MKKVLFLEDRPARQKVSLPNKEADVIVLREMNGLHMPEVSDCKAIINNINEGVNVIGDVVHLIIIHESTLTPVGLNYLDKLCKERSIDLILFSGGIGQMTISDFGYKMVYLNVADLYTDRLIPFLKNFTEGDVVHILELINSRWKVSYLLLLRQLLSTKSIEERAKVKDIDRILMLEGKISKICSILQGIGVDEKSNIDSVTKRIRIELDK